MTAALRHSEKAVNLIERALEEVNLAVASGEFLEWEGGVIAERLRDAVVRLEDR